MAVFREKNPPFIFAVLLLAAAFFFIYPLTEIGKMELFQQEGFYAALALETGSFPVVSKAHGEVVAYTYPLYPFLVKLLHSTGLSMEYSLRILSLFFLFVLSVTVGCTCYFAAYLNCRQRLLKGEFSPGEVRKNLGTIEENTAETVLTEAEQANEACRSGIQAAAVGAGLIFATVLAGEKALEGNPVILSALLVFAGWLLWFREGVRMDSWNRAWLWTFIFASLAFYNGGWFILSFFFIPMFFLKRPLKIWTKLHYPGFWCGLFLLILTIIFWEIPRWDGTPGIAGEIMFSESFGGYMKKLFYLPFDLCIRFLPWTFFLYAPFCPALTAIDRNRLFMKYLRRIFLFALLLFWLNPLRDGRDYFLCAPVLAVLTALDYWIVVRRYGERLCTVFKYVSVIFFVCGICCVLLYILPESFMDKNLNRIFDFSFLQKERFHVPFFIAVMVPVLAGGAFFCVAGRKKRCLWLAFLLLGCCMMGFFHSITVPFRCSQQDKKTTGLVLRKALGTSYDPGMTIYKDAGIDGLYDVGYYLGTKLKVIRSYRDVASSEEKSIFILSARNMPPGDAARTWTRLVEYPYKNQKLYIWKGALNERKYTSEEEAIRRMQF